MRDSFIFYRSWAELINHYSDEKDTELTGTANIIYKLIKPLLEFEAEAEAKKNKRAEARKSAITDRIELKDSELVNLTADEYEKLKAKYGENLINTAIFVLEDWLQSGKSNISRNAKNALGKPHYYYFRKDGWVLPKAKKLLEDEAQRNQPNWSI